MDTKNLLNKLYRRRATALEALEYTAKIKGTRLKLYGAGKKFDGTSDYYRVFPRDSFTSAFLLRDSEFLKNLLIFSIKTQGKKSDPLTGEESGKVPHEYPGVAIRGRSTLYASVDATLLFLLGLGLYWDWTRDAKFIRKHTKPISNSLDYLLRHIRNGLFWDDPKYCGAKYYALWSGCWRDGGYPERKYREHLYPASYLMVNIFAVNALRSLVKLAEAGVLPGLQVDKLRRLADKIKNKTLSKFWLPQKGYFASAIDAAGVINSLYLDSVWSLYFLEKDDLPKGQVSAVFRRLKKLETPFGYLSREKTSGYDYESDKKKLRVTIWPYEHAYLARTAEKFGIELPLSKTLAPLTILSRNKYPFSEYIEFDGKKPKPQGCHVQLWTIAYIVGEYLRLNK